MGLQISATIPSFASFVSELLLVPEMPKNHILLPLSQAISRTEFSIIDLFINFCGARN